MSYKVKLRVTEDAPIVTEVTEQIVQGGFTPTGTLDISENGDYNVAQYAQAAVDVPNSYTVGDEGKVVSGGELTEQTSRTITENATYDTTLNNSVAVNVPNTYTQADEGKVVDGGALVEQTARTITANGQYDTTTNDDITVNVPQPSGAVSITENGAHDVTDYATANVNVPNPSTGELTISANGTYDVTEYASAAVNVSGGAEYEEILLYTNPNPYATMAADTVLCDVSGTGYNVEDFDYIKAVPYMGTPAASIRWSMSPCKELIAANVAVNVIVHRQHINDHFFRLISAYPSNAATNANQLVISGAIWRAGILGNSYAVPYQVYGIIKK